ncbi:hypothetical protein FRB95_002589 [Tulasnella sp. JGI-2019a]|nr:hypothetical protein FRB95_002589 [Tulasnella sp. JGI-2019a]
MSLGGDHAIDWPSFDEQIEEEALRADADSVSYFLETQRETLPPYTNQILSGGNAVPPVIETSVVENAAGHLGRSTKNVQSPTGITERPRWYLTRRAEKKNIYQIFSQAFTGDNPIPLEALARIGPRSGRLDDPSEQHMARPNTVSHPERPTSNQRATSSPDAGRTLLDDGLTTEDSLSLPSGTTVHLAGKRESSEYHLKHPTPANRFHKDLSRACVGFTRAPSVELRLIGRDGRNMISRPFRLENYDGTHKEHTEYPNTVSDSKGHTPNQCETLPPDTITV